VYTLSTGDAWPLSKRTQADSPCRSTVLYRYLILRLSKTLSDEMDHGSSVITIQGHLVVENLPVGRPSGCGSLWYKEIAQLVALQNMLFLRPNQEEFNVSVQSIPCHATNNQSQASLASKSTRKSNMYSLPLDAQNPRLRPATAFQIEKWQRWSPAQSLDY
jgi:hypothetical protein